MKTPGMLPGRDTLSVRAAWKTSVPLSPATVPKKTPTAVSRAPSTPTVRRTWRGVAPASRWRPNSPPRYVVDAYRVLISMTQQKTPMIPTTTRLTVSRFLSSTVRVSPDASITALLISCMDTVAVAIPVNRMSGISTPLNWAALRRVLSTAR